MPDQNNTKPIKPWYRRTSGLIAIGFFSATMILFMIFAFRVYTAFVEIKTNGANPVIALSQYPATNAINPEGDGTNYWIGSAKPKITIVEFADFACPHCKNSFPAIREISVKYKKDVKLIYRDFPVISDYSADLALAARCAGEQGLFWPMHDKLFQNDLTGDPNQTAELANQIGVNKTRFTDCVTKQKYSTQIQNDLSDGNQLGVNGTPTWFINGQKTKGDIPPEGWEQIIQKLLN
jgi:protein-disulfide isomerase